MQCNGVGRARTDAETAAGAIFLTQSWLRDGTCAPLKSDSALVARIAATLAENVFSRETGMTDPGNKRPQILSLRMERSRFARVDALGAERTPTIFKMNDRTAGIVPSNDVFRTGVNAVAAGGARFDEFGFHGTARRAYWSEIRVPVGRIRMHPEEKAPARGVHSPTCFLHRAHVQVTRITLGAGQVAP